MGETNIIQIQIPTCSSNYQISKDIYSFLNKQGNHIPIQIQKNRGSQSGGFNIPFFGNIIAKPDDTTTTTTNPTTEEEKKTDEETKSDEITQNNDDNESNIHLQFQNKTHTIDHIKGTKLYYLYLRNGECARWV